MNMQNIMAQAQKMQRDMQKKKGEIDAKEFISKNDFVEVTFTGDKKLKSIKIDSTKVSSEDTEILEDMITLAINDAMKQIDSEIEDKMGALGSSFGGLF